MTSPTQYAFLIDPNAELRDVKAHAIAHAEFVWGLLIDDNLVSMLCRSCEGLAGDAYEFALAADRTARACGLPGRREMWDVIALDPASVHPELLMAFMDVQAMFMEQQRLKIPGCRAAIRVLVTETWGLPWPWLEVELARWFQSLIDGVVFDRTPDVDELLARVRRTGPPRATSRRGAFLREERIRRDVEWFYLHRLKDVTTYALAKASGDSWQKVDAGISRAARLLGDLPTGTVMIGLPRISQGPVLSSL